MRANISLPATFLVLLTFCGGSGGSDGGEALALLGALAPVSDVEDAVDAAPTSPVSRPLFPNALRQNVPEVDLIFVAPPSTSTWRENIYGKMIGSDAVWLLYEGGAHAMEGLEWSGPGPQFRFHESGNYFRMDYDPVERRFVKQPGQAPVLTSPDGEYMLLQDATGLRVHHLTSGTETSVYPARVNAADWFPDSSRIVFTVYHGGCYFLYAVNIDGSDLQLLTFSDISSATPYGRYGISHLRVSPDGGRIAYSFGRCDVWTRAADGSDPRAVRSGVRCQPLWEHLVADLRWGGDSDRLLISERFVTGQWPEGTTTYHIKLYALSGEATPPVDIFPVGFTSETLLTTARGRDVRWNAAGTRWAFEAQAFMGRPKQLEIRDADGGRVDFVYYASDGRPR